MVHSNQRCTRAALIQSVIENNYVLIRLKEFIFEACFCHETSGSQLFFLSWPICVAQKICCPIDFLPKKQTIKKTSTIYFL